ncbi:MAG: DUF2062 domain-containing protein [Desulfobulbaceae bacterium]|jgi:uncharacterized protein (DUF2062 family)|nr:DUF2062 domain-containing protein [Desulfobulbaceae bacterium]
MPKKRLKKLLPQRTVLRENLFLRKLFGSRLFDPHIWYLNKNTISIGLGCGFFIGYLPIPMQMAVAAILAICFRFNLPAAIMIVWISNPLTWVALYYPAYKLGAFILGQQNIPPARLNVEWFMNHYPALFLGCFIIGLCGGIGCIIATRILWRLHIIRRWLERKRRVAKKKGSTPSSR